MLLPGSRRMGPCMRCIHCRPKLNGFLVTGDHGESPSPHPGMYVAQLNVVLHPFPCTHRSLMEGTGSLTSSVWNVEGVGRGGGGNLVNVGLGTQ